MSVDLRASTMLMDSSRCTAVSIGSSRGVRVSVKVGGVTIPVDSEGMASATD